MKFLTKKATLGLLAAAAIAVPIAGCGGDDSSSGGGSYSSNDSSTAQTTTTDSGGSTASGTGGTLALAADPSGAIKYDKTSLSAPAGKVAIDFTNESQVPHAVEIEGNGVGEETSVITQGKTTLTADLKPGTYEFYCPVDSHKEDGMKGVLTVK